MLRFISFLKGIIKENQMRKNDFKAVSINITTKFNETWELEKACPRLNSEIRGKDKWKKYLRQISCNFTKTSSNMNTKPILFQELYCAVFNNVF